MGGVSLDAHVRARRGDFGVDVHLSAQVGSVLALLGPNGSGKTTTLDAIAGLLPLEAGHVRVSGRVWADAHTCVPPHERSTGVVASQHLLFPHLSALDNVAMPLKIRRVAPAEAQRTAVEMLSAVGLGERVQHRPAELSGGERRRLQLLRLLLGEPNVLMLDEPSLGLAPLVVRDIFATISALRATGVTILLVEQNARAALEVANHGHVLETGAIVLEGPAAALANDPRVIETYLGAAAKRD